MQVLIFCKLGLKMPIHAPKLGFWGQNWGRSGAMLTPQWTRSNFWVLLPLCHFWWKSIKKCDRVSADRQTHTLIESTWIYNLSPAICYSYGADNYCRMMGIPDSKKDSNIFSCIHDRIECLRVNNQLSLSLVLFTFVLSALNKLQNKIHNIMKF